MSKQPDRPDDQSSRLERRANTRFEVISRIEGEDDGGAPVVLLNISDGGALVQCAHAPQVGEVHEFRFAPEGDQAPLVFAARVVHLLRISGADGGSYALGLEFVTSTDRQRQAIADLIATAGPTVGHVSRPE